MTFDDFEKLYDLMVKEEQEIATTKGREYVDGSKSDRLNNFKRIGQQLEVDPKIVLSVYLQKHLDSINNFIREGKTHSESIEGRIMDARLYLALLRALIQDEKEGIDGK